MIRRLVAVWSIAALFVTAVAAFGWPLNEDWGYAAYRKAPSDKCVPGVKPALSVSKWIVTPTTLQRHPQKPWLTIRVDGRDTGLGTVAVVLDKELMLPVMAGEDLGLTPTRSGLNHQLLTLSGGRYLVKLRIGSRHAEVGYARRCLPVCPKWYNGKVYMPFESLGKLLDWEFSFNVLTGVLDVRTRAADLVSHRNAATWAHQRKLYDEAIGEYEAAVNLDDDDWSLYRRMGDAFADKGKLNDALAAAHVAIGEALEKVRTYKRLAETNPGGAMAEYRKAVTTAVARVNAYRKLGATYHPLTNVTQEDTVLDIYDRTLLIDPGCSRVAKVASTTLVTQADLNEALRQAAAAAARRRRNATDSYGTSLTCYHKAIERAPASVAQHKDLAERYYRNNQPAKAAEEFQKALMIDPEHATVRIERAQSLLSQGDFAGALQEIEEAIRLTPKSAAARNVRGYTLRKQGKDEEAIAAYREAIELDGDFAIAYNNLGVALLGQSRAKEATEALRTAVKLAPKRADFYANYGLAFLEDGQLNEAAAAWGKAVALAPDSTEYHANLAMVMQRQGKVDGAIGESRAALDLYDKNLAALNELRDRDATGGAAMQREARSALDRARLTAQCTLAWGLLERGRVQEALTAAREAVQLGAQDAGAQAALAAVQAEKLNATEAARAIDIAIRAEAGNGLYEAIAATSKAMIPGRKAEAEKHLGEAMHLIEAGADRWSWYFLGRACAALGLTQEARRAYLHPQPDKHDPVRRQQIADYVKRHPARKPALIEADVPAPKAATPEAEGVVAAEIARTAGEQEAPTLKIANTSDKDLDVLLDTGLHRTLWAVLANETREASPLLRGAGAYQITITAKNSQAKALKQTYEFEARQAYTITVTVAE